jgi:PAS domain S-box-containing protein
VANAIDVQQIKDLTGSQADLNRPSYQRLKEQLTLVRSATPSYRFLYLMGRRPDGTVFFFVDSEAPESRSFSPPGEAYDEASPALQHLFSGGNPCIEGPVTDRWGRWVSGLIPIVEPSSGTVIAVFGADVDVSDWFRVIAMECTPPVAVTLILAAAMTILFTVRRLAYTRQTQEAMRESEEKHRILFESSRDAIMILATDSFKFTHANPMTLKMFGAADEREFLSLGPSDVSPQRQPDGVPSVEKAKQMVETAMRTGSHFFEWTHRRLSGEEFPATVMLAKMELAGQILVQATVRDITLQKEAERSARASETRFSTVFDASPAAIAITRLSDNRFVDVNPAWRDMTGRTREEAIGRTPADLNLWANPEQRTRLIDDLREHGTAKGDVQIRSQSGEIRDALMSAELVELAGESYMLTTAQDISDRKLAEEVIAEANRNLEKANRDLKDMQSQVVQSEKLASIGQLAAGVAHEMNTPVGFVASNFQTLQKYMAKLLDLLHLYEALGEAVEDGQKERRLEILGQIKQARKDLKIEFVLDDIGTLFEESEDGLTRVTTVIKNLKDFSRIDQAVAFAEYDLNQGVEATLNVARNEIKYDVDVKTDLLPLPEIECNSGQINQVILNILLNAVQAIKVQKRTDRGTLTIRTYATPTEVICEISDDGPGIPPEIRHKIFDPFFTTKPVGQGTGLGLSVSHDIIVTKHHGQILVDSTVGKGTTFTIKLPLAPPPSVTSAGPLQAQG